MTIVLRRRAKLDLLEARRWYEERQPSLGTAFLDEIEATLHQVGRLPEIHPRVGREVRRAALRRFPYGIFYRIDGETIRVIAILHRARNPQSWQSRQ